MKYLPYENFEIHSKLTSDEVFYKLRAAVDTQRKWFIFTNKPFWGEVDRHYFRIWLVNIGKQNFTPYVLGKIQPKESGCCIRIKMRMPWFGFLFYTLILAWFWIGYFRGVADLVVQKSSRHGCFSLLLACLLLHIYCQLAPLNMMQSISRSICCGCRVPKRKT
jgi:hypothetical protein